MPRRFGDAARAVFRRRLRHQFKPPGSKRLARGCSAAVWRRQHIAEAAHGLDHIDAELTAQASDENFDRIRVAIEILIVKMLDDFRAGNDPPLMMHEIGEQPVFVRGELDRTYRRRRRARRARRERPGRRKRRSSHGRRRAAPAPAAAPVSPPCETASSHNRRPRRRSRGPSRPNGRAR